MVNNQEFSKKLTKKEDVVLGVVTDIAKRYNPRFRTLELPTLIRAATDNNDESKIVMPAYDGTTYNKTWGENYGGSRMGLDLSKEIPHVVKDLSKIDISSFENNENIKKLQRTRFNLRDWLIHFKERQSFFVSRGTLQEEISKSLEILSEDISSPLIFSNGDFYPRNFIKTQSRIVLIDWEGWEDDYRINFIDHLTNVIAVCYVHMWGNTPWQLSYLNEVQKIFHISAENFQKSLIVKSLDQAYLWRGDKNIHLYENQMDIFRSSLNYQSIRNLLSYTKPRFSVLHRYKSMLSK